MYYGEAEPGTTVNNDTNPIGDEYPSARGRTQPPNRKMPQNPTVKGNPVRTSVWANRLLDQGAGLLGGFLPGADVFLDRQLFP